MIEGHFIMKGDKNPVHLTDQDVLIIALIPEHCTSAQTGMIVGCAGHTGLIERTTD